MHKIARSNCRYRKLVKKLNEIENDKVIFLENIEVIFKNIFKWKLETCLTRTSTQCLPSKFVYKSIIFPVFKCLWKFYYICIKRSFFSLALFPQNLFSPPSWQTNQHQMREHIEFETLLLFFGIRMKIEWFFTLWSIEAVWEILKSELFFVCFPSWGFEFRHFPPLFSSRLIQPRKIQIFLNFSIHLLTRWIENVKSMTFSCENETSKKIVPFPNIWKIQISISSHAILFLNDIW